VETYLPPYELTSDMLFAATRGPTGSLRRTFPGVPFLEVRGRTPLLLWFSRVREACYYDPAGQWRREGGPTSVLYYELTVLALLRERAVFAPGIYATSERTIALGRQRYGMPKQPAMVWVQTEGRRFRARALHEGWESMVHARLVGSGRPLGRLASLLLPQRPWPVRFPAGRDALRVVIQAGPRLSLARIVRGRLAVQAAWLPRPVRLLPLGLYAPSLRMQLPP
jgi:hypothetical protein